MSIAEDFAVDFIEYMSSDINGFNTFLLTQYRSDDLFQIIVFLYWQIANKYDLTHHRPIPGDVMYELMYLNLNNVIEFLHFNDMSTDIESIIEVVETGVHEISIDGIIKNEKLDKIHFV